MISSQEAAALIPFTDDDRKLIAKICASVDSVIVRAYSTDKSAGAAVKVDIQSSVDAKIAYAVTRKYEEKGWKANVLSSSPLSLQFTPSNLVAAVTMISSEKYLPPIVHIEAPQAAATKRLLVRMPTRSRPQQAIEVLTKYRAMAGIPITIEVVIDADDSTMMDPCVLQRLYALGCIITVGEHTSKIDACNAGRVRDWDILVLASDDMVPVKEGYAKAIVEAMEEHWPFLDGALHFPDGFQQTNLCTLPVMGRRFYKQFGYVYAPQYTSLFSDTEQTVLWGQMKRIRFVDEKIIEHRHHVTGKSQNDALYRRNDALWNQDKAVFEKRARTRRENAQFSFDTPPVWLSVCIVTMPSRKAQLQQLVEELYRQKDDCFLDPLCIEILVEGGEGTVGEKRQRLLERSVGHFVAFVDDDDMVSHDYLDQICEAIEDTQGADCVAITGIMTTSGSAPEKFVNNINQEWETRDGVHLRGINHLCPVRREIALKAGFPSKNHAEDFDYAEKIKPFLKSSAKAGENPIYFYFFQPGKPVEEQTTRGGPT